MIKSIPTIVEAGLAVQAAQIISTVKSTFDISQGFKESIAALPPHFIAKLHDLYCTLMYKSYEAGLKGMDKDIHRQALEAMFMREAENEMKMLDNNGKLLEALRAAIDENYDCGKKESEEPAPSVLEEALSPEKALEPVTAGVEPAEQAIEVVVVEEQPVRAPDNISLEAFERLKKYVSLLGPEKALPLAYQLGIAKDIGMGMATASVELENDSKPEPLEMIGVYSIDVIREKTKALVTTHNFSSDTNSEMEIVDTIEPNALEIPVPELIETVKSKLCLESCPEVNSMEEFLEYLDGTADLITEKVGLPVNFIFIIVEGNLVLAVVFTKQSVSELVRKNEVTAAKKNAKAQGPIPLKTKKEIEALATYKSLSGVEMKVIKKHAPTLASYLSCAWSDFRNSKMCAWKLANDLKKPLKDIVEACYGPDAAMYFEHVQESKSVKEHLKGDKVSTKASTNIAFESKDFNEIQNKWMIIKQGKMEGDSPRQSDIVDSYVIVHSEGDYVDCEYRLGSKIYTLEEIKDIEKNGKKA